MNCTVCNIICIKPDENCKSSNNIANFRNGSIICNACVAVLDMMGSETKTKTDTKKEQVKVINPANSILCPKCRERFSEQTCKCGFKNPLFRK
jgi:hypothetical protein